MRQVQHKLQKILGGTCGGTYIDRNLHSLLEKRYGEAFSSLSQRQIGPGRRFMNSFESRKRDFRINNVRKAFRVQLKIPAFYTGLEIEGYDKNIEEILLSKQDMLECFEPVVDRIIGLESDQTT